MLLEINNLSYIYGGGTPYETIALKDINLKIEENSFNVLIGHTGSGKSTLVQHMNGLLKGAEGEIFFKGENIYSENYKLVNLRQKVGLVFQYPENQLFEDKVIKDVSFGPKNIKMSEEDIEIESKKALELMRIPEEYWEKSPMDLSGGEKRRVAIAGVLAMKPELLILDEPTAGLDPKGKNELLELLKNIKETEKITIILVTHSMEIAAQVADKVIVMDQGEIIDEGSPKTVFKDVKRLEACGLAAPEMVYLMKELKSAGLDVDDMVFDEKEVEREILKALVH